MRVGNHRDFLPLFQSYKAGTSGKNTDLYTVNLEFSVTEKSYTPRGAVTQGDNGKYTTDGE